MGWLTFLNLSLLTLGPIYIAFKCSILSEYSAFGIVFKGFVGGFLSYGVRMVGLATVFSTEEGDSFSIVLEAAKTLVMALEVYAMQMTMKRSPGNSTIKVLGTGLGWGSVEAIGLIPVFWMKSRALEFDFSLLALPLESSIKLVVAIAFAALVFTLGKKSLPESKLGAVKAAVGSALLFPLLVSASHAWFGVWEALAVQVAGAVVISMIAHNMWWADQ